MKQARAFLAVDSEDWFGPARKYLESAVSFVEADINRRGGIGGVSIKIEMALFGDGTANDYLRHASETPHSYIYPFVIGASGHDFTIDELEGKKGLFCLVTNGRENLTSNAVAFNFRPTGPILSNLCSAHGTDRAVVVSTDGAPRFELNEGDILIASEDELNSFLDTNRLDEVSKSDLSPSRTLIVFDDFGWETHFKQQINKLQEVGYCVNLYANNYSDGGTGATWYWPLDTAPDIEIISRLRSFLPSKTLHHINETALQINCFRFLYVFQQACREADLTTCRNEPVFYEKIKDNLQKIDGSNDVYVDSGGAFRFDEKTLESYESGRLFRNTVQTSGITTTTFAENQPPLPGEQNSRAVIYIFCDILRVAEVNVEERFWSAEFELECSGASDNLLSLFTIANLSQTRFKLETELIASTKLDNETRSEKYLVRANLTFEPQPVLFPFDEQTIGIQLELKDNKSYLIQPTPTELTDDFFEIDGWEIRGRLSGVRTRKRINRYGPSMLKEIEIVRTPESQWVVRRQDSRLFVRSVLPLSFLFLLSWYSTFVSHDDLRAALTLNTTAFLSSIALLFALDRPKVPGLTLIDIVFLTFHLVVGTITVGVMLAIQVEAFYSIIFPYLKYFPVLVASIMGLTVYRRLKMRI